MLMGIVKNHNVIIFLLISASWLKMFYRILPNTFLLKVRHDSVGSHHY